MMARVTNNDGEVIWIDPLRRVFVLGTHLSVQQSQNAAGNTFSLIVDGISGAGAGDYVLYFENIGTFELNINSIFSMATAQTTLWVDHVSGTPAYVSATTTRRTNRRLGAPNNPVIDSRYDTNITGLTQEGRLLFERIDVVNQQFALNSDDSFVIDPNEAFAIRSSNPAASITLEIGLGINLV